LCFKRELGYLKPDDSDIGEFIGRGPDSYQPILYFSENKK
jgi:hypothetical protein